MTTLLNFTHFGNNKRVGFSYAKTANRRWHSDSAGNEWDEGYRITWDDYRCVYDLWTDDGVGNGEYLASFRFWFEAVHAATDHDNAMAKYENPVLIGAFTTID